MFLLSIGERLFLNLSRDGEGDFDTEKELDDDLLRDFRDFLWSLEKLSPSFPTEAGSLLSLVFFSGSLSVANVSVGDNLESFAVSPVFSLDFSFDAVAFGLFFFLIFSVPLDFLAAFDFFASMFPNIDENKKMYE